MPTPIAKRSALLYSADLGINRQTPGMFPGSLSQPVMSRMAARGSDAPIAGKLESACCLAGAVLRAIAPGYGSYLVLRSPVQSAGGALPLLRQPSIKMAFHEAKLPVALPGSFRGRRVILP
jgi:hypothetical protein